MSKKQSFEVIIIGAGASGLACAQRLLKQNVDLVVLEARNRVGGRVWSLPKDNNLPPVELGAEFIHSASPAIMDLVTEHRHTIFDVQMQQLYLKNNRLIEQPNFWERFEKVLALMNAQRSEDRSVAEFLKVHPRIPSDMRKLLIAYVEGFQAADIHLIGERSFALSEQNKKELNGIDNFRPNVAYEKILEGLFHENQLKQKIRLQSTVREIHWSKSGVEVQSRSSSGKRQLWRAKHVVLAVPLGVLKSQHLKSRIQFFPALPKLTEALENIYVGHAHRMTFYFKTRFWETLGEKPIGFLRAGPEHPYPTWWTLSPLRAPYLVAWQGGPKALEMSRWTAEERIEAAYSTLSALTGKNKKYLRGQTIQVHQHNWSQDPFSLGAYSYTGVQTKKTPNFSKPFEKFLWLTGEATALGEAQGTVHGALSQGYATAQALSKRL